MPLLPGTLAAPVDRLAGGGGTLGFLDYSHPIFDEFKDPRNGNFSTVRFFATVALTPGADRSGAGALRRWRARRWWSGRSAVGRVIAFTSTLDNTWNDFPNAHLFLPLVHETVRYLAQYEEPGGLVHRGPDARHLGADCRDRARRRGGRHAGRRHARRAASSWRRSGEQVTLGEGGESAVELAEQGFYSVRLQGMGDRRPFQVAVNLDPAESDLSALPPAEFVEYRHGTGGGRPRPGPIARAPGADAGGHREETVDLVVPVRRPAPRRCSAEAVLANRLSKRFGFGLLRTLTELTRDN